MLLENAECCYLDTHSKRDDNQWADELTHPDPKGFWPYTQTLVVVSPNPAVCDQLFLFAAFTDEIARKLAERLDSVEHLRCQAEWSLSVAFIFPNIEYVILNSLNLTKGFDILIVQFRHQLF